MPRIFPDADSNNVVICVSGVGARNFSALITDSLPCLDNIEKGQCFPLYLYEVDTDGKPDLLSNGTKNMRARRHAISDIALSHFRSAYTGEKIGSEDVFYYIYGLLQSPDYLERYADNLSKEMPRIPCVSKASAFWAFSKAGRALAKLHLDYEKVTPFTLAVESSMRGKLPDSAYRVEKMRYGKIKVNGKNVDDKTTLIYNDHITLKGIPLKAYDYVVNGKPALDWVVERQCVKTDKDSGIVNDANLWAIETMGDPKYPLELFQRVITVSLETMKIVEGLPPLDIKV